MNRTAIHFHPMIQQGTAFIKWILSTSRELRLLMKTLLSMERTIAITRKECVLLQAKVENALLQFIVLRMTVRSLVCNSIKILLRF